MVSLARLLAASCSLCRHPQEVVFPDLRFPPVVNVVAPQVQVHSHRAGSGDFRTTFNRPKVLPHMSISFIPIVVDGRNLDVQEIPRCRSIDVSLVEGTALLAVFS